MKSLRHLNKYLYKYRFRFLLGLVFVVSANLFSVFPAQAVGKAIDLIKENLNTYLQQTDTHAKQEAINKWGNDLLYFAALIISFAIIRGVFMFLMRQTLIVMSRKVEYDLKNEIFEHYQILPQSFYRKNNTGDLMARISEDVSRVRMYIGPAVMYFTNLMATFVVVIPYMYSVNAMYATLVLLPLPFLSYAIFKVHDTINKKSDAIQSQLSSITSFVQEAFSGIRVIKAFGAEAHSRTAFDDELEQYRERSLSLAKVDATFFPLMIFLTGLSTLLAVAVGGMLVFKGAVGIGHIAEFIIYVNLLTWPVASLGFTTSLVQRAAASQERINEFLAIKPSRMNEDMTQASFNKTIEFKHVSFQYDSEHEPVLKDIHFTLAKGQQIAIIGSTGSGKSTLVQLLVGIMDATSGQILVDGIDIKQLDSKSYKSMIGYAPQDVFLFSDTIGNNILFGTNSVLTEDEKSQRVQQAAAVAALDQTIASFQAGYETIVGERGIALSGGQKQRVAIARAIVNSPQLVILDDAMSAVDLHTESQILEQLKTFLQGKTSVIVSHRVSTVKDADHILVLENGEIVEQGNHRELMLLKGRYEALYTKQLADDSEGESNVDKIF